MMCWTMNPGATPRLSPSFLKLAGRKVLLAADNKSTKLINRYHAPVSGRSWVVVETDDIKGLYEHTSAWGEYLTWEESYSCYAIPGS